MFPDSGNTGGDDDGNLRTRAVVSNLYNRLNIAVYDAQGKRVKQVNQQAGDAAFGTAVLQVDPGRYQVVAVAHSSAGNPTMTDPTKIKFENKDGFSDTFLYATTVQVDEDECEVNADLKRIVSLCRVALTDAIPDEVTLMQFQYKGGSGAFNASTGMGSVKSTQTVYFAVEPGKGPNVFDLYTFLHHEEDTIHLQVTAYDTDDHVICEREFDVPMRRCQITTLSGPFFSGTDGAAISVVVGVHADWEGEETIYI